MVVSNPSFTERSKVMKKSDYVQQLQNIVADRAKKLTVKQLKQLIAKYQ